ncbi:MAG: DNA glycosylase AlkZ-like family protein [Streptosporangiaceae bacterium]
MLRADRASTAGATPRDALAHTGSAETPSASLLPAFDPTPMGWKHRDWMFGIDQQAAFDQAGNVGPTVWWNGEIIGSWATTAAGEVRTRTLADRGSQAVAAVDSAAARLHERLDGATITPAIRTPLERSISHMTGLPPLAASASGVPGCVFLRPGRPGPAQPTASPAGRWRGTCRPAPMPSSARYPPRPARTC